MIEFHIWVRNKTQTARRWQSWEKTNALLHGMPMADSVKVSIEFRFFILATNCNAFFFKKKKLIKQSNSNNCILGGARESGSSPA